MTAMLKSLQALNDAREILTIPVIEGRCYCGTMILQELR
jgi:hypothetical protein